MAASVAVTPFVSNVTFAARASVETATIFPSLSTDAATTVVSTSFAPSASSVASFEPVCVETIPSLIVQSFVAFESTAFLTAFSIA